MRRRAILSLTASCLLGACAHPVAAPQAGMAWSLNRTPEEGVKLAFGRPQSDDVLLMLTCMPGSRQVMVSVAAVAEAPVEIASGATRSRLSGQAGPGMGAGSVLVESSVSSENPALARFSRTGLLSVAVNGVRTHLPSDSAGRGRIAGFFADCRRA